MRPRDRSWRPTGSRPRLPCLAPRRSPAAAGGRSAASSRCRYHDVPEVAAAAIRVGASGGQFLEIVAAGECRSSCGQHDRAHGTVLGDRSELSASAASTPRTKLLRVFGRLSVSTAILPYCPAAAPARQRRWGRQRHGRRFEPSSNPVLECAIPYLAQRADDATSQEHRIGAGVGTSMAKRLPSW